MAAATVLTATEVTRAGVAMPTGVASDATNGNAIANDGNLLLILDNTDSASHTVTFAIHGTLDGVASPGKTVTLAATTVRVAGPFPTSVYGDVLGITTTAANVTIAALHHG